MPPIKKSFTVGIRESHIIEIEVGLFGKHIVRIDGREIHNRVRWTTRLSFDVGEDEHHHIEIRPQNQFGFGLGLWIDGRCVDPHFLTARDEIERSPLLRMLDVALDCILIVGGVLSLIACIYIRSSLHQEHPDQLDHVMPATGPFWVAIYGVVTGGAMLLTGLWGLWKRLARGKPTEALARWSILPGLVVVIAAQSAIFWNDNLSASQILERATGALQNAQPREAVTLFNILLTLGFETDPPTVHLLRGHALYALKEGDRALLAYDEGLRIDPRSTDGFRARGMLRHERGDGKGAIADLERALEVAPANWPDRRRVEEFLRQLRP